MALTPLPGYAPGVPRDVDIPESTLIDVLDEAVAAHSSAPALDFFGRVTSYRTLREQVTAGAAILHDAGVRPGDRVSIILPTSPQAVVAFYAVLDAGGIVVEQNPLYTADELALSFRDHGARVAIVWDKIAETIAGLDIPQDLTLFTVNMTLAMPLTKQLALRLPVAKAKETRAAMTAGTVHLPGSSWDRALQKKLLLTRTRAKGALHEGAALSVRETGVRPSDVALLQYTGGTTGTPKAAMLTHRNLVANVAQSRAWVGTLREGEEVFYAILPLFHAYGMLLSLLCSVRMGACLVIFPRFDADMVLDAMTRRPATFLPGVPPIYSRIADAADKRAAAGKPVDLTSIRTSLSGAMPLPAELVERWEALTGGLLIEGYGMTETSPIALGNPLAPNRKPGSVGLPYPSTEMRVVDPDAEDLESPDAERAHGEPGELLLRGPQVFAGYWNSPEQTAMVLLPGGWLRTGDIVEVDDDGFVTIVDRVKDLIITGGFNVYPSEVEDHLRDFPGVEDAAVVGVPGADGSEDVHAAIVLSPGVVLDSEALRTYLRQRLAGYKVPKGFRAVTDLPRSAIGKVLRKDVRAALREFLGR